MARPEPSSVKASARRFFRIINPAVVYTPVPRTDIAELWLGGGEILAMITNDGDEVDADADGSMGERGAFDATTRSGGASAGAESEATGDPDSVLADAEPSDKTTVVRSEEEVVVTLGADGTLPKGVRSSDARPVGMTSAGVPATTIDATGMVVCPGWVDMHCHVTGGGGEDGFKSRTPEASMQEMAAAGITTFVGVLGTDSVSRTLENLMAKVRGLAEEGMTGYMWTGAYRFPPPLLTESVIKDVMLVPEVLGVGELAISDHRGSQPTPQELARLASDTRVGGMLSGKAGLVYAHVGKEDSMLQPLWDAVRTTAIPLQAFVPTHISRTPELTEDALRWIRAGGFADVCSGRSKSTKAALRIWEELGDERSEKTKKINKGKPGEIALDRVSISSDCYGSKPVFDDLGKCISYGYQKPSVLMDVMSDLLAAGMPPETVIRMLSTNPARTLGLYPRKGTVREGADADLLIFNAASDDKEGWDLLYVIMRGRLIRSHPGRTSTPVAAPAAGAGKA